MKKHSIVRCVAVTLVLALAPVVLAEKKSDAELMKIDPPADLVIPPAPVLSPQEALKSFVVEEGFEVQLVAAEPMVEDPVCMAWDEQGRLWVAEMKGYMPNHQAQGENEPVGNIVVLEDLNGDGVFDEQNDKRTVWMDGIVLPRAIAFANRGVLYADKATLYFVRLNRDGSAGARMPIDHKYSDNGGGPSNVEHQANGLLYGLDNWYYSAKSSRRYQQISGRFRRGETEFRGQWGITQDDDGRLIGNRNPVLLEYDLFPPSSTNRNPNFKFNIGRAILRTGATVHPVRVTPGTNRAYRPNQDVSHQTWKLKRATAACGPVVYRGTQFPEEFYGNYFVCEPAGHLLKRIILGRDGEGKPTAKHAYRDREFLASTDERSRFVNAYTGPDGCLYVVDMYRGLIQHKGYLTSYLKRQVLSRGLDKPAGNGRIYRVVHKATAVDHAPVKLGELDSVELVKLLAHRNSWRRFNAQRLLVQRRDAATVEPLTRMATTDANPQARIHALWTLKGMDKLTAGLLATAGASTDLRVRAQVLRLAEDYAGKPEALRFVLLMQQYDQQAARQPNWPLDLQIALTGGALAGLDTPQAYDVLLSVLDRRGKDVVFRHAVISGLKGKEAAMLAKVKDGAIKQELAKALVKATESGDLTIGSLLALVDSPEFEQGRNDLLKTLATQAVDQGRHEVIDSLVQRLSADGTTPEAQQAIMTGLAEGRSMRATPIELDGKPAVFDAWSADSPAFLDTLAVAFEEIFVFEREVISAELAQRIELGSLHYATHCSTCHGPAGEGVIKSAPPLIESEWVTMHPKALAMLVLNGVEGDITVNGTLYTAPEDTPGIMPGLKAVLTSDEDVANILTYIRSKSFKNNAGPVEPETIAEVRALLAGQEGTYTPAKLMQVSNLAFKAEGVEPPGGFAVIQPKIVKPGWLDRTPTILVLVLLGVAIPLALLLGLVLLGARAEPIKPAH